MIELCDIVVALLAQILPHISMRNSRLEGIHTRHAPPGAVVKRAGFSSNGSDQEEKERVENEGPNGRNRVERGRRIEIIGKVKV